MEATKQKTSFKEKFVKVWSKVTNNPSFTTREMLGYSAGIMGNSATQDVEAYALTLFLTNFMGIGAVYVLILELISKIANIITDPVAGIILDRRTKKGRSMAKIFSLIAPLPLCVTSILLFVVPNLTMTWRIVWVFVFYLIYITADSFYDMSLNTISARMTTNPKDRKNFYTVAQFAETLGGMLPSGMIPIFVSLFYDSQQYVYLVFAIIFAVLGFFLMITPAFTLTEKTHFKYQKKEQPVSMNFKAVGLNRPMWMLLLATVFDSLRQVTYTGLAYFYLETLDSFWMASVAGAISATLSYVGILAVPFIGSKFSSRDIIMGGYMWTGLMYVIILLLGGVIVKANVVSLVLIAVLVGLAGLPNGAMSSSRKILLADSTDYMEYMTWKKYGEPCRSEAMVFAVNATVNRVKSLFKSLLFPAGLLIIGYISARSFGTTTISVVQSEDTLMGIFYLITICAILGNALPALFMAFDNYTGKRKEKILAELNEMRAKKLQEYEQEQLAKKEAKAKEVVQNENA